jgi:hypothetical protein
MKIWKIELKRCALGILVMILWSLAFLHQTNEWWLWLQGQWQGVARTLIGVLIVALAINYYLPHTPAEDKARTDRAKARADKYVEKLLKEFSRNHPDQRYR